MDQGGGNARERLVAGAQELLAERGYSATSPRAVLDRSQAGQGSLYHHFTDKADLARTALSRTAEQFQAEWDEVLSAPGTAIERIVSCFGHEDGDVLLGCPIGRQTQDEGVMSDTRLSEPVATALTWLTERLETVIAGGVESGEFVAETPSRELAATITALIQGCYVLSRASRSAQPFRDAAVATSLLLERGLRP